VLYTDANLDGLCEAIERFEGLTLSEGTIRANAERFAPMRFQRAMAQALIAAGAA
jgi:hypothetical protein